MTARFGSSDAVGVVVPPSARRSVSASLSGLACVATVSHRLSHSVLSDCRTATRDTDSCSSVLERQWPDRLKRVTELEAKRHIESKIIH